MWLSFLMREPRISYYYFPIWIKSIFRNKRCLYHLPWMTFGALDWLDKNIRREHKVFEWGSGGSTLYWAKKAGYVCSIEHNSEWYEQVRRILTDSGLNNFDYKLMELGNNHISGNHHSQYPNPIKQSLESYCRAIESFPDNYFDLIVIDGRLRLDCAKLAIAKVKDNGRIILDNAERKEYLPIFELMKDWKKIVFRGPGLYNLYPWDTVIFSR